jgi:hypothetical protein
MNKNGLTYGGARVDIDAGNANPIELGTVVPAVSPEEFIYRVYRGHLDL